MADKEIRCDECGKLLALKLEGKLEIYCPRCKHFNRFVQGLDKDGFGAILEDKKS